MVVESARAKVNLFLHVVGRRPDGYHLLDSLVVFPGAADVVQAAPAYALSLEVGGAFGQGLAAEPDNLVLRAARALAAAVGRPALVALTLVKGLPVASGIGGGSADAAATLRALQRLWDVTLEPAALARLGEGLGADVPVCIASRPARMGGIGEVLAPAPALPACGMVLVNPGVAVSTPAVFAARGTGFSPMASLPSGWADTASMASGLAELRNDLQAPAVALCPEIADVLDWLGRQPGCLLARMSGSGATCFGLFGNGLMAERAARVVPSAWWAWGGDLVEQRQPGP